MSNPIKRLNYYDHEFLRATDFTAEQTYHMSMRRLHNQVLHTWGVAQGLTLALAGTAVTVAPGVAIDSQGREMVVATPTNLDLSNMPLNTTQYVTIAYGEQTSDHTTETGGDGDTRWTEQPTISMATSLPADTSLSLLLGQITRAQDGSFSLNTSSLVPAAAVTPPDITANSLTLKNSATSQAQWPRLSSAAANQATLNGNLAATGDLSCNNLTATGNLSGAAANVTGTLTCDHVVQNNPAADLKVSNSVSVGSPAVSGSKGSVSTAGDMLAAGNLSVSGTQNLIDVFVQLMAVQNADANDNPGKWTCSHPKQFSKIYARFVVFQGFSIFGNNNNTAFNALGHSNSSGAIPQHVFVRLDSSNSSTEQTTGTSYCSESTQSNEGDNAVLFTVVVIGKPINTV